jgi:hypothetical protein
MEQSEEWLSTIRSETMAAAKKTERETKLELEERLRAREAEERAQLFKPRALAPIEKFKKIRPTGSHDGYG